jgi:ABC-2 type transport system ATP-binding protein
MKKLGRKQLTVQLFEPMQAVPAELATWNLVLKAAGTQLEYRFDINEEHSGIPALLRRLDELGIAWRDLNSSQSSLEDIFVSLVHDDARAA